MIWLILGAVVLIWPWWRIFRAWLHYQPPPKPPTWQEIRRREGYLNRQQSEARRAFGYWNANCNK